MVDFTKLRNLHWWWRHYSRPHHRQDRVRIEREIRLEKKRLHLAGLGRGQIEQVCRCLKRRLPCGRCAWCKQFNIWPRSDLDV